MKRNLLKEIAEKRSRSEFYSRFDISSRLNDIKYAINENLNYNGDLDNELSKYIPIATIACFEAFFRSVFKELIDFGKPYSDRVTEFNQAKNVKFDFDIVNAIQNKSVTAGEFVAHILPCSSLAEIDSNLTTLINTGFLSSIRKFEKKSRFKGENTASKYFIKHADTIIKDVLRTYELRNIFCHEFATNVIINKEEIFRYYSNCKLFLDQTNDFIWDLLYPNSPETQTEMNIDAAEKFKKVEKDLADTIKLIKAATKENVDMARFNNKLFDQTIVKWKKYRETKAKLEADSVRGGSMYSLLYSSSLTSTTEEKINSLKNDFAIDLRRFLASNPSLNK